MQTVSHLLQITLSRDEEFPRRNFVAQTCNSETILRPFNDFKRCSRLVMQRRIPESGAQITVISKRFPRSPLNPRRDFILGLASQMTLRDVYL